MKLIWSEPKELSSAKCVKTAIIQEVEMNEFWEIWNDRKEEIKENGFSIKKYNNKWQLSFWCDEKDININKKCYDNCRKFGFVEKDNRKEDILDFLNNLKDEFENKNCLELFEKIKYKLENTYQ